MKGILSPKNIARAGLAMALVSLVLPAVGDPPDTWNGVTTMFWSLRLFFAGAPGVITFFSAPSNILFLAIPFLVSSEVPRSFLIVLAATCLAAIASGVYDGVLAQDPKVHMTLHTGYFLWLAAYLVSFAAVAWRLCKACRKAAKLACG